jgi:MFS family permease
MVAWTLRYLCFAFGNAEANYWMLLAGIIIHGVCYDFFFVAGQIYTDNLAGEKYKNSAQGFITLATYGVGMLIGFTISGPIVGHWKTSASSHDWQAIWLIPGAIALVVMLLFVLFFKDTNNIAQKTGLDVGIDSAQLEL